MLALSCVLTAPGCKFSRINLVHYADAGRNGEPADSADSSPDLDAAAATDLADEASADSESGIVQTAGSDLVDEGAVPPAPAAELELADAGPTTPISLEQVVDAIYQAYPLLSIALAERQIAFGENVQAQGAFDLKLTADSLNTPQGFYETYRQFAGFEQPLYGGGSLLGGYKLGRGNFEPWYGNRQTNEGGEFFLGMSMPLLQNRAIDERRAELWRSTFGQDLVEPEIRSQLLLFVRDGSIAYWEWVAAGQNYRYAGQLLKLARDREEQLKRQVEEGDLPEADLTDNQRLIVGRRVKQLDALRKLQLAAAKLSLYLRLPGGMPFVPGPELLPKSFPEPAPITRDNLDQDIMYAQARRPELLALDINRRQLDVDLQQAANLLQPEFDAQFFSSKDVGDPTPKGDKTPYQLEAGVMMAVPLQRRKARGKVSAVEGKIAQWHAKRQFTSDKISVEVQAAVIALDTAFQAIAQARDAIRLNEEMERYETIRLEQGDSDFLRLNLRETATFDARVIEVEALLRYFEAQSEYRAAIAADLPEIIPSEP